MFRTGCLMTGDAGEAEGLVQETFLRVARRWHQVESMDREIIGPLPGKGETTAAVTGALPGAEDT